MPQVNEADEKNYKPMVAQQWYIQGPRTPRKEKWKIQHRELIPIGSTGMVYLPLVDIYGKKIVSKYTSPMDPMRYDEEQ